MKQPYHHGALRQALLEAAGAILEEEGIEALTLRAAARRAGVSHASPAHHFGDLSGLLSELAASGFILFSKDVGAELEAAGPDPKARLIELGYAYVRFARSHPGLFHLMFRSGRLDWSSPSLAAAGAAAFALMMPGKPVAEPQFTSSDTQSFVIAIARWSLVHGLSTLEVDGRLKIMSEVMENFDIETMIKEVLMSGLTSK